MPRRKEAHSAERIEEPKVTLHEPHGASIPAGNRACLALSRCGVGVAHVQRTGFLSPTPQDWQVMYGGMAPQMAQPEKAKPSNT